MPSWWATALLGALVATGSVGCGSSRGDHPAPGPAFERLRHQPPEEVGATVDGQPIGIEEFRRFWRADRSRSVDEVIEAVIDREIAVQRAVERGYHRDEDLGFVRKKAMVRELLRREIEDEVGVGDVDESIVEKIEKNLRNRLGHPRGLRASHLLVMVPQSGKKKKNKHKKKQKESPANESIDTEALKAEAKTWAEKIRATLPARPTAEDLFFARREFRSKVDAPLKVVVNSHISFPGPGTGGFSGKLPGDWMRVVRPFATATDEMLSEGRAGELSEPVESKYGWHLVLPEERLPGKRPDPEVLHEVAVSQALRVERARRFESKLKEWRQGMSIAGYPSAIAEQAEKESR